MDRLRSICRRGRSPGRCGIASVRAVCSCIFGVYYFVAVGRGRPCLAAEGLRGAGGDAGAAFAAARFECRTRAVERRVGEERRYADCGAVFRRDEQAVAPYPDRGPRGRPRFCCGSAVRWSGVCFTASVVIGSAAYPRARRYSAPEVIILLRALLSSWYM